MTTPQLYRIFGTRGGGLGMAHPAVDEPWLRGHPYRLAYDQLRRPGRVTGWREVEFVLHEGRAADCMITVEGVDLYSQRLRQAIEDALSPVDDVQWLPALVRETPDAAPVRRWLVQPLTGDELLDTGATRHAPAEMAQAGLTPVIKGVYSAQAVGDRQILKYPYGYPPVVTARVRDAIEAAGCTGISFSRVPLV